MPCQIHISLQTAGEQPWERITRGCHIPASDGGFNPYLNVDPSKFCEESRTALASHYRAQFQRQANIKTKHHQSQDSLLRAVSRNCPLCVYAFGLMQEQISTSVSSGELQLGSKFLINAEIWPPRFTWFVWIEAPQEVGKPWSISFD